MLSRFVDHKEIGFYQLAPKLGFMVSFLPQGFRIALRPLRKTAMFEAVRDQYGSAVANGQLLAYFWLITLTAVLAMVLGGEIVIQIGGGQFESAAPLIPLTAATMSMPALYRSVNGQSFYPNKRRNFFIGCVIFAALSFVGCMLLLVPRFGIVGTPIASMLGFLIPSTFMFISSSSARADRVPLLALCSPRSGGDGDRGRLPLRPPVRQVAEAARDRHPARLWFVALSADRHHPKLHHWDLLDIAKGFVRRGRRGSTATAA